MSFPSDIGDFIIGQSPIGGTAVAAIIGRCDLALAYDAVKGCSDLVWNGRDFALDDTPATPMLMALLARRRAHPTDTLPDAPPADPAAPASLLVRGGWPGDALDGQGRFTGSRLWLLWRAKQTEQTRRLAEDAAAEALGQVEDDTGLAIAVQVSWSQALAGGGVLLIAAAAGGSRVAVTQRLGG